MKTFIFLNGSTFLYPFRKHLRVFSWLLVLNVFVISGCQDDSDIPDPAQPFGKEYFVAATDVGTLPKTLLQTYATAAGFGNFTAAIKYDVTFYKFTYKTTYKDAPIEASGLLAVPKNTPAPPALLSAQHGTMFKDTDAPSNFPASFTGFELFGAAGFITVIPDFIGYGVSKDIFHPYYDEKHSALAVVDMLKAAKFYLEDQKIAHNDNLFLVGYSEGGYVTMAAQKEIETNPAHKLTLTAAAEGAGGYDLTGMLNQVATATSYSNPSFLAFILQSYNTTYNWNRPLTDFFQQPYATELPGLFNGTKDIDQINTALNPNPAQLFNTTFYANLANPAGETQLNQALAANSFPNWYPKSPTRLYHGTNDEAVFYQTSETTFNRFKAAGATNVQFISIPGGTHRTSIMPMMLDALTWIETLNK